MTETMTIDERTAASAAPRAGDATPAAGPPRRGRLVVLSGPSGSGKTTICNRLLEDPRFRRAITATTRPRRPGEVDGVDYVFLDEPTFRARIAAGDLLEWAEVYGHLYGTPRAPIEADLAAGALVLLNIDVQGAETLRARGAEAISIFLLPPSLATLEARLRARASDSEAVVQRRLAQAAAEMALAHRYDHRVLNDDAGQAAEEARRIVLARHAASAAPAAPAEAAR